MVNSIIVAPCFLSLYHCRLSSFGVGDCLQEDIVDEMDEYVDVHRRIYVVAVAATSIVVRAPSICRLTSQKAVRSLHPIHHKTMYHLVNKDQLAMMKKGVMLVNCSRGL